MRWGLLVLLLICSGCGRPAVSPGPVIDQADGEILAEAGEITTIEQATAKVAQLAARLAAAKASLKELEEAKQAAQLRALKATAWWIAGIAMVGTLLCIAAAVFLPVARRLLLTGAGAGFALMVAALTLSYILPYLVWVGMGLALVGVIGSIWYLWKLATVQKETALVGVQALKTLDGIDHQQAETIKTSAAIRQTGAGIYNAIRGLVLPLKEATE
jgi:hypothetical protein